MTSRMRKLLKSGVTLVLATLVLSACTAYVSPGPGPGAHWVPGHFNRWGGWVHGHWG